MRSLDRRRLLTSGAAAAVLAASGVRAAASPKRGGVLRLGISDASPSDRWSMPRPQSVFLKVAGVGCAFETLTEVAPDKMLRGELADSWEPMDKGQSWVFGLRRGVRFHDGRILSANDVVASLQRHQQMGDLGVHRHGLSHMDRIRAVDPLRVRVDLAFPDPDFPLRLADPHAIIHPKEGWKEALVRGIGTGLYRLERFEAGTRFSALRVEDHWKGESVGWFDRVTAKVFGSQADRLAALLANDVDVIDSPGTKAISFFARSAKFGQFAAQSDGAGAAIDRLGHRSDVGDRHPFDDARIAQRWWFA